MDSRGEEACIAFQRARAKSAKAMVVRPPESSRLAPLSVIPRNLPAIANFLTAPQPITITSSMIQHPPITTGGSRFPHGQPNDPGKFWKSFERMRRHDHRYEWGIVIQQNDHPDRKRKRERDFLSRLAKRGRLDCRLHRNGARKFARTAAMARSEATAVARARAGR